MSISNQPPLKLKAVEFIYKTASETNPTGFALKYFILHRAKNRFGPQIFQQLIWCISKCVNWAKIISGYDTIFDFHTKFDILECFQILNIFSSNMYVKNGIFETCYRESAKCKMTARTGRKYYVSVKNWTWHCILPSKHRCLSSDNFFVFSV